MFLAEEVPLALPASVAQYRMMDLLRADGLEGASSGAFADGNRLLLRAGAVGASKEVQVLVRRAYFNDDVMVVPIRWLATGPVGGLFPQMDGNVEINPGGPAESVVRVVGSYRPPLGVMGANLDRVLLNRVARATFREFLRRLLEQLTGVTTADDQSAEVTSVDDGTPPPDRWRSRPHECWSWRRTRAVL